MRVRPRATHRPAERWRRRVSQAPAPSRPHEGTSGAVHTRTAKKSYRTLELQRALDRNADLQGTLERNIDLLRTLERSIDLQRTVDTTRDLQERLKEAIDALRQAISDLRPRP